MPIHEPMRLHTIPNFCGGRLLTNFFGYTPREFEVFFKEIVRVLGTAKTPGNLGMIAAYTNLAQAPVEPFLERLGFKKVFVTDKYDNYDREAGEIRQNSSRSSPCISWVGDWYNDVLPAIQQHVKELEQVNAEQTATSNLRRPAAPVTATPPPEQRDATQFVVGDVVRVVFSTRLFTIIDVLDGSGAYTCRSNTTGNLTDYYAEELVLVNHA